MHKSEKLDYDAVVVGSGPNGISAAITLLKAGLSVLILEAKNTAGGGLRSAELTLPGFSHDICSAIHPMAMASPFFSQLPLQEHGLRFTIPPVAVAHPFDDGNAAALLNSLSETAKELGPDEQLYLDLLTPLVANWKKLAPDLLGPLRFPSHPLAFAKFGLNALTSSSFLAKRFQTRNARGLWAGLAAHSIQPLTNIATSAIALVLAATGHINGWPVPLGGSQSIAKALISYFEKLGGKVQTGIHVKSLQQLPRSRIVLFDVTPKQLLEIAGHRFSSLYRWQLNRYRYGMGVFKIDWALDAPIPFTAEVCRQAGTIHLGNSFDEIRQSEKDTSVGAHPSAPFVLLAQQSLFDPSRAPEGKHTAWAYCHVPNGSTKNMKDIIEKQVERFAPGFREQILATHTMNTEDLQQYNPNYVGGDINGGIIDIGQLFTRPALRWSPYRTSAKGIYICSSSTPPGGGVHGMCGYHAARRALKDLGISRDNFER